MKQRFACRVVGHRWEFFATGQTLRWRCGRGCGADGTRQYESSEEAERFAFRLNRSAPGPPLSLITALGGIFPRRNARPKQDGTDLSANEK